jgi:hypothetical protein
LLFTFTLLPICSLATPDSAYFPPNISHLFSTYSLLQYTLYSLPSPAPNYSLPSPHLLPHTFQLLPFTYSLNFPSPTYCQLTHSHYSLPCTSLYSVATQSHNPLPTPFLYFLPSLSYVLSMYSLLLLSTYSLQLALFSLPSTFSLDSFHFFLPTPNPFLSTEQCTVHIVYTVHCALYEIYI